MNADRRAALLLMDMDKRDRLDILARLPESICARVLPGLAELSAMGVESGHDWLDDVIQLETGVDERTRALGAIAAADAEAMSRILAREPDCVVATLLATREWAWAEDYLRRVPGERRRVLSEQLAANQGTTKPRVMDCLLVQVAARLRLPVSDPSRTATFEAALADHDYRPSSGQWRPAWAR